MVKIGKQGMVLAMWLLLVTLVSVAVAGPFEDGRDAYNRSDYAEAARLFRNAAEQGHAAAQFSLGYMYYNGQGLPRDYVEAVRWLWQAAQKGDAKAQVILGTMFDNGHGVPQDYVQAHKWYNLAASRLSASESAFHDLAVETRDRIAAKMTPTQVAEAQRLAREWRPK